MFIAGSDYKEERIGADMTRKFWCLLTLSALILLLAGIAAVTAIVDPFEIYHRAWFYNPPYKSSTQMYAQAGVAKSYTYDSVIIGSSVTENCTPSVYDAALGGRFVKLSMNAGTARDHAKMMEIALRTHDVRSVVYGLDLFAYSLYYTNQKAVTPDYLYDDALFNDVNYLLNKNVLLEQIPQALARIGVPDEDASRDSMYYWSPPEMPGEKALRAMVNLSSPMPSQGGAERALELAQLNLEHNLLPYIRDHRETTFFIFFPPYSLLYWANEAAQGNFDACMAQKRLIGETLLAEPNVQLYDFQTHADWVEDYSLYYDLIHYTAIVNDAMASSMAQGMCRVEDHGALLGGIERLRSAVSSLFPQP